jgi:hypothetical protein
MAHRCDIRKHAESVARVASRKSSCAGSTTTCPGTDKTLTSGTLGGVGTAVSGTRKALGKLHGPGRVVVGHRDGVVCLSRRIGEFVLLVMLGFVGNRAGDNRAFKARISVTITMGRWSGVCFVKDDRPRSRLLAAKKGGTNECPPRLAGCMLAVEAVLSYRQGWDGHAWVARVIWMFRGVVRPRLKSLIRVFDIFFVWKINRTSGQTVCRSVCATGDFCCMQYGNLSDCAAPAVCIGGSGSL